MARQVRRALHWNRTGINQIIRTATNSKCTFEDCIRDSSTFLFVHFSTKKKVIERKNQQRKQKREKKKKKIGR
jgi:hypothetical protein